MKWLRVRCLSISAVLMERLSCQMPASHDLNEAAGTLLLKALYLPVFSHTKESRDLEAPTSEGRACLTQDSCHRLKTREPRRLLPPSRVPPTFSLRSHHTKNGRKDRRILLSSHRPQLLSTMVAHRREQTLLTQTHTDTHRP